MLGRLLGRSRRTHPYTELYERHARQGGNVGIGDYDLIGRLELAVLRSVGLTPASTLLDFGCGDGRLAIHAVPFLAGGGNYIGIDVSTTFLAAATQRVADLGDLDGVSVTFHQQSTPDFELAPASVDVVCAFSVFTHMEHEDMYRYLGAMRHIVKDDGAMVISVLPLDLAVAREIFLQQAALDPQWRWQTPRNVTTTREMVETIAGLAGWSLEQWLRGDEPHVIGPTGQLRHFGQTLAVLRPA